MPELDDKERSDLSTRYALLAGEANAVAHQLHGAAKILVISRAITVRNEAQSLLDKLVAEAQD